MLLARRKILQPVPRNFEPAYFSDPVIQAEYESLGYTVIKDIVREEEIKIALAKFREFQKDKEFTVHKNFESSGNFQSVELQTRIFDFIREFMKPIFFRFANLERCEAGDGGAFFIKPNTPESILHPHQDSAVIDETTTYGAFAWIPLCDTNSVNGALYFLPRSHLWGNSFRSQHIPWAFRKWHAELWKHMVPVYVQKGDLILFDTAIIHASGVNRSDQVRLALCGALLPSNHQKIEYLINKAEVRQYLIDSRYWLDGGDPKTLNRYEFQSLPYTFPNPVREKQLKAFLKAAKP